MIIICPNCKKEINKGQFMNVTTCPYCGAPIINDTGINYWWF